MTDRCNYPSSILTHSGPPNDAARLRAETRCKLPPLIVARPQSSVDVVCGEVATFELRINAAPAPTFTWFVNNCEIQASNRHQVVTDARRSRLIIHGVSEHDCGDYMCVASNPLGETRFVSSLLVASQSAYVASAETLHTAVYEGSLVEKQQPPHFLTWLSDARAAEGDSVEFRLRFCGYPHPNVAWYHNGMLLTSSGSPDFQILVDEERGETVLSVLELFSEDAGTYCCELTNRLGSDSTVCHLTVELTPLEVSTVHAHAHAHSSMLLSTELSSGEYGDDSSPDRPDERGYQFTMCAVQRQTSATGMLNVYQADYELAAQSNQLSELFISTGNECKLGRTELHLNIQREEPIEEERKQLSRLTIETHPELQFGPPQVMMTSTAQLNLKSLDVQPPQFVKPLPASLSLMDGEDLRLRAVVAASPMPTPSDVGWLRDGQPLREHGDLQVMYDESSGECALRLCETFPQDAGTYTCRAQTVAGNAATSCLVNVQPFEYVADSEETSALSTDAENVSPRVVEAILRDRFHLAVATQPNLIDDEQLTPTVAKMEALPQTEELSTEVTEELPKNLLLTPVVCEIEQETLLTAPYPLTLAQCSVHHFEPAYATEYVADVNIDEYETPVRRNRVETGLHRALLDTKMDDNEAAQDSCQSLEDQATVRDFVLLQLSELEHFDQAIAVYSVRVENVQPQPVAEDENEKPSCSVSEPCISFTDVQNFPASDSVKTVSQDEMEMLAYLCHRAVESVISTDYCVAGLETVSLAAVSMPVECQSIEACFSWTNVHVSESKAVDPLHEVGDLQNDFQDAPEQPAIAEMPIAPENLQLAEMQPKEMINSPEAEVRLVSHDVNEHLESPVSEQPVLTTAESVHNLVAIQPDEEQVVKEDVVQPPVQRGEASPKEMINSPEAEVRIISDDLKEQLENPVNEQPVLSTAESVHNLVNYEPSEGQIVKEDVVESAFDHGESSPKAVLQTFELSAQVAEHEAPVVGTAEFKPALDSAELSDDSELSEDLVDVIPASVQAAAQETLPDAATSTVKAMKETPLFTVELPPAESLHSVDAPAEDAVDGDGDAAQAECTVVESPTAVAESGEVLVRYFEDRIVDEQIERSAAPQTKNPNQRLRCISLNSMEHIETLAIEPEQRDFIDAPLRESASVSTIFESAVETMTLRSAESVYTLARESLNGSRASVTETVTMLEANEEPASATTERQSLELPVDYAILEVEEEKPTAAQFDEELTLIGPMRTSDHSELHVGVPVTTLTVREEVPITEDTRDEEKMIQKDVVENVEASVEADIEESATNEVEADIQLGRAPEFTEPLADREVQETQPAELYCIVAGQPFPDIRWFHNDQEIDLVNTPYRVIVNEETGECVLGIDETYLEDRGVFRLSAANDFGVASSEAELIVHERPVENADAAVEMADQQAAQVFAPVLVEPLSVRTIVDSGDVELACRIDASPAPRVTWAKDGVAIEQLPSELTERLDFGVEQVDEHTYDATLVIAQADAPHAGQYEMTATNSEGSVQSAATVEAPLKAAEKPLLTASEELPEDAAAAAEVEGPQVNLLLRDLAMQEVFEGESTIYVTAARTNCQLDFSWKKDEEFLDASRTVQHAHVFTLIGTTFDELVEQLDSCGLPESAVVATREHLNEAAIVDHQLTVDGQVPIGDLLQASVLLIAEATPQDDAAYRCEVYQPGDYQIVESTGVGELFVVEAPRESVSSADALALVETSFGDLKVNYGDEIKLQCVARGRILNASWMKDGTPIVNDDRHRLEANEAERTYSLVVPEAEIEDEGTYTFTLESEYGTDTCSACVSVYSRAPRFITPLSDVDVHAGETAKFSCVFEGVPKPTVSWFADEAAITPSDKFATDVEDLTRTASLEVRNVTPEDAKRTWMCRLSSKIGQAKCTGDIRLEDTGPVIKKPLQSLKCVEDESAELELELDRADVDVKWMKDGKPLSASEGYEVVQEENVYKLRVPKVEKSAKGKYTAFVSESVQSSASVEVLERPLAFVQPLESISCNEKDAVTFRCELNRAADVTWMKDGKPIKTSSEFFITKRDCECALTIAEATPQSAGTFSVKAGPNVESKANLTVNPIQFVKPLEAKNVTEEESVEMVCELNTDRANVTWSKDGKAVVAKGGYTISQDGAVHKLVIAKSVLADKGTYAATVRKGVETKANLQVAEKPVAIVKPLENVECFEEDAVTFSCELSEENVKVTWLKDEKPIAAKQGYVTKQEGPVVTLSIPKAAADSQGTYTVKVTDDIKSSANLLVNAVPVEESITATKLEKVQEPLALIPRAPDTPQKPTFTSSIENADATVHLQWDDVSSDEAPVTHYIVEVKASDNEKWTQCDSGQPITATSFSVKNLKEDVEYAFRVTAVNQVAAGRPSDESAVFKYELDVTIVRPLEDVTLTNAAETASFECEVSRDVAVQWLKDGKPIVASGKLEFIKAGCTHRLLVKQPTEQDAGEYSLSARTAKTAASLRFAVAPALKVDRSLFDAILLRVGETKIVEVPFDANPRPTVCWQLSGKPLAENRRIKTETVPGMTCLTITKAEKQDAGDYNVTIENEFGKLSLTIGVKVLTKPGPPRNFIVAKMEGERCLLTWEAPEDTGCLPIDYIVEKREANKRVLQPAGNTEDTQLTVEPLTLQTSYVFAVSARNECGKSDAVETPSVVAKYAFNVPEQPSKPTVELSKSEPWVASVTWLEPSDGGSPITNYVIEMRVGTSNRWDRLQANEKIVSTTFQAQQLKQGEQYAFRVAAENKAGLSKPSEPSDSVRCIAPLELTRPLQDIRLPEFRPAVFECELSRDVAAEWFKGNKPISKSDKHYSIEKDGLVHRLTISKPEQSDEAEYKLVANEVSTKASLFLEIPPVFGLDQSAMLIKMKAGDTKKVELPFIASAAPSCSLKFNKAKVSDSKKVKTELSAKQLTLTFNKVEMTDAGEYTVTIENKHGKSEAIVNLTVVSRPSTPRNAKLVEMEGEKCTLSWDEPAELGGLPVQYVIEMREGTKRTTKEACVTAERTASVGKLTIGNTYTFLISAKNDCGQSDAAEVGPTVASLPFTVPGKPGKPAVEIVFDKKEAILTWKEPESDGGSPITGYIIESKSETDRWQTVSATSDTPTALRCVVSKLREQQKCVFRITAENKAGRSEPSEPSDLKDFVESIEIIEPLKDVSISELPCSPLRLHCRLSKANVPVEWFKDGAAVRIDNKRHELVIEDCDYTLVANDVNPETVGQYEMRGKKTPISTSCRVEIKAKPKMISGSAWQDKLRLRAGSSSVIELPFAGSPKPHVAWSCDGRLLSECKKTRVREESVYGLTSLSFARVEPADAGLYSVRVENEHGWFEQRVTVEVLQRPLPPTDFTATCGEDSVELKWLASQASELIPPTLTYQVEYREASKRTWQSVSPTDSTSLRIDELQPGGKYAFQIFAENEVGRSDPASIEATLLKSQSSPPRVENLAAEHYGALQSTISVSCLVTSASPVKVRWFKNRTEVQPGSKYAQEMQDSTATLQVLNFTEKDAGTYRVEAENRHGVAKAQTELMVFETPRIEVQPTTLKLVAGGSGKIRVSSNGKPTPTVSLLRDGVNAEADSVRLRQVTDNEYSVSFADAVAQQAGEYEVHASNAYGEQIARFVVSVRSVPSAPRPPFELIQQAEAERLRISWQPSESDGGSPITAYLVEAKEANRQYYTQLAKVGPNDTSCAVNCRELPRDGEYYFRVRAVNDVGESEPLNSEKCYFIRTRFDVPGCPTGPLEQDEVAPNTAKLSWKAPKEDGGLPILEYVVKAKQVGKPGDYETLQVVDASNLEKNAPISAVVDKLADGETYRFRVFARNQLGLSEALESPRGFQVQKPPGPPVFDAPLRCGDVTENSVKLTWCAPIDDGGAPITGYSVEISEDGTSWKPLEQLPSMTRNYVAKNLTRGTPYYFRVFAENKVGLSEPITSGAIVPTASAQRPGPPDNLRVTGFDKDALTLEWSPVTDDGGSPLTGFTIEYRDLEKRSGSWQSVHVKPDQLRHTLQGLRTGHEYALRVRAENIKGVSEPASCEPVRVTSPFSPPSQPVGPMRVSQVTDQSLELGWQAPLEEGSFPLQGYLVEMCEAKRSQDAYAWRRVAELHDPEARTCVASGLRAGDSYVFRVRAFNKEGLGDALNSGVVNLNEKQVLPQAPYFIRVVHVGQDNATVEWRPHQAARGAGHVHVDSYVVYKRVAKKIDAATAADVSLWEPVSTVEHYITQLTVAGLRELESYYFAVASMNEAGLSTLVWTPEPIEIRKSARPPSAPVGPLGVTQKGAKVQLSWLTPTDDGGSPITGYLVFKREAFRTRWTQVADVQDTSCSVGNLIDGNQYEFKVVAVNSCGQSEPLLGDKAILIGERPPEELAMKLEYVKAEEDVKNAAKVSWASPDAALKVDSYSVQMRETSRRHWSDVGEFPASQRETVVQNLSEGVEYEFRVLFSAGGARSVPTVSNAYVVPIAPHPPAPPRGAVNASCMSDGQVLVEWLPPLPDHDTKLRRSTTQHYGVQHYRIEAMDINASGEKWVEVGQCDAGKTSMLFANSAFVNGHRYYFRVSAVNEIGSSEPVQSHRPVLVQLPKSKASIPEAPAGKLVVEPFSKSSVMLNWQKPRATNELVGYAVDVLDIDRVTKHASFEWQRRSVVPPQTDRYLVDRLEADREYMFRVSSVGDAVSSAPVRAEPVRLPALPDSSLEFTARSLGNGKVMLEWTESLPELRKLDSYRIEMCDIRDGMWWLVDQMAPEIRNTYVVRGLNDSSTYMFRVIPVNKELQNCLPRLLDEPITAGKRLILRDAPVSLEVDSSFDAINLHWSRPTYESATSRYRIQTRKSDSTDWRDEAEIPRGTYAHSLRGLQPDSSYQFRIKTVDEDGESEALELPRSITIPRLWPKPPSPLDLSTELMSSSSARLSWRRPHAMTPGLPVHSLLLERWDDLVHDWAFCKRLPPHATYHDLSYLKSDVDYLFRLSSENFAGRSEPITLGAPVRLRQRTSSPPPPPQSPEAVRVINETDTSVTIGWRSVLDSSAVSGYLIEMCDMKNPAMWTRVATTDYSERSCKIECLRRGNYRFRVFAQGTHGRSEPVYLDPIDLSRKQSVPASPTGPVRFGEVACDRLTLSWSPPHGHENVKSYEVRMRSPRDFTWKTMAHVDRHVYRNVQVRGLMPESTYVFQIVALNEWGTSRPLESGAVTTPAASLPPVPTLQASSIGRRYALLEWQSSHDIGNDEDEQNIHGYTLYKRKTRTRHWEPVCEVDPFASKITLTNLKENENYEFGIQAYNYQGVGPIQRASQPVQVAVARHKPASPQGPITLAHHADALTIGWKSAGASLTDTTSAATEYLLELRALISSFWQTAARIPAKQTQYSVPLRKFQPRMKYEFRITAVNAYGVSDAIVSDVFEILQGADVPSSPIGPLEACASAGDNGITLRWRPPKETGNSTLLGYNVEIRDKQRFRWRLVQQTTRTELKLSDLPLGNEYEFRVSAFNSVGAGAFLTVDKPLRLKGAPESPLFLHASLQSNGSVQLEWSSVNQASALIESYEIQMSAVNSRTAGTDWVAVAHARGSEYRCTVAQSLIDGEAYLFRIRAKNDAGASNWITTRHKVRLPKKTPRIPAGPLSLTESQDRKTVKLNWHSLEDDEEADDYVVEMAPPSGKWFEVSRQPTFDSHCELEGLPSNVPLRFRIRGLSKLGYSDALEFSQPYKIAADQKPASAPTSSWKREKSVTPSRTPASDADYVKHVRRVDLQDGPTEPPNAPAAFDFDTCGGEYKLRWKRPLDVSDQNCVHRYIIEMQRTDSSTQKTYEWTEIRRISAFTTLELTLADFLVPGCSHDFRLCAVNRAGKSAYVPFAHSIHVPRFDQLSMRDRVRADITDDRVSIRWNPLDSALVDSYLIEVRDTFSGRWTILKQLSHDEFSYVVRHLEEGVQYDIRVRAIGKYLKETGEPAYVSVQAPKLHAAPEIPCGSLQCEQVASGCVRLRWHQYSHLERIPTRYVIEKRESGYRAWTVCCRTRDADTNMVTIDQLVPSCKYCFRVRAENSFGLSEALESDEVLIRNTVESEEAPCRCATFGLLRVHDRVAVLNWSPPISSGSVPIAYYLIESKLAEPGALWTRVARLPSSRHTYEMQCEEDGLYAVRIVAVSTAGSRGEPLELPNVVALGSALSMKSTACAPGQPRVTFASSDSASLEWRPPADFEFTRQKFLGYVVEKREAGSRNWHRCTHMSVNSPKYNVIGLLDGGQYEFRVAAAYEDGLSEYSRASDANMARDTKERETLPEFTRKLADGRVVAGANMTFSVEFEGNPTPSIRWFHNLREIYSDTKKYSVERHARSQILTLHCMRIEDCGTIECRATNRIGTASSRSSICVIGPPVITTPVDFKPRLTFKKGETLKISLPFSASTPTITWFKDLVPITADDVRVERTVSSRNEAVLFIDQLRSTDSGVYTVEIRNDLGTQRVDVEVTVLDRPAAPPSAPIVTHQDDYSICLSWPASRSDGGAKVIGYVIERCESSGSALRHVNDFSSWSRIATATPSQTETTIRNLRSAATYQFRVRAENVYGVSEPSEPSKMVTVSRRIDDNQMDKIESERKQVTVSAPSRSSAPTIALDAVLPREFKVRFEICEEVFKHGRALLTWIRDRNTRCRYIMKVVRYADNEADFQLRDRFTVQSVLQNSALSHAGLLTLHDAYQPDQDTLVLLFDASVENGCGDILDLISTGNLPLTESDVACIIQQLLEILVLLHGENLVHLHLRPSSLITSTRDSYRFRMVDWVYSVPLEAGKNVVVLHTEDEIPFLAPELLDSHPQVHYATDIWAVGVLTYLFLSGKVPFVSTSGSVKGLIRAIQGCVFYFDGEIWNTISDEARDFIESTLCREMNMRPSAADLLQHAWLRAANHGHSSGNAGMRDQPLETSNHRAYVEASKSERNLPILTRLLRSSCDLLRPRGPNVRSTTAHVRLVPTAPKVKKQLSDVEAYQGGHAKFRCQFESYPEARITFMKDDVQLATESNKRYYVTRSIDGHVHLTVSDLTAADSGFYTVIARNDLGEVSTSSSLTVIELNATFSRRHYRSQKPAALVATLDCSPTIVLPLLDQSLLTGDTACLSLAVTGSPDPQVTWFHEENKLATHAVNSEEQAVEHDSRYRVVVDRYLFKLIVSDLKIDDAGKFSVLVSNKFGELRCQCTLNVQPDVSLPPNAVAPYFIAELSDVVALVGETVRFECKFAGSPTPKLRFLKNRTDRLENADARNKHYVSLFDVQEQIGSLIVQNVTSEDEGYYEVVIENDSGCIFSEAYLTVKKSSNIFEVVQQLMPNSSPQFCSRLRNRTVDEGIDVKLACSVLNDTSEAIAVRWMKDGRTLASNDRYRMKTFSGMLELSILGVKANDSGHYSVDVSNSHGSDRCGCQLAVRGPELAEDFALPEFTVTMHDAAVQRGEMASFNAVVSGVPLPSFKFQKDAFEITDSNKYQILADNIGGVRLVIKNANESDEGLYRCVAYSRAGRVMCSAFLHVLGDVKTKEHEKPAKAATPCPSTSAETVITNNHQPSPATTAKGAPQFSVSLPDTFSTHEGDNITLRCKLVDTDDRVVINWHRGNRELTYNVRYRIVMNDREGCVLEVSSAMLTDSGEYSITARNRNGEAKSRCYVEVLPKRRRPSSVVISEDESPNMPRYTKRSASATPDPETNTHRGGSCA